MTAKIEVQTNTIRNRIKLLQRAYPRLKILYCCKSLPVPKIWHQVHDLVHGLEASNKNEFFNSQIGVGTAKPIYLTATNDKEFEDKTHSFSVLPTVNSLNSCSKPFFVRINPIEFLDSTIFKDLSLKTSRFGVTPTELLQLENHPLYTGIHLHLGRTIDNSIHTFQRILHQLQSYNVPKLNIGGGFHNMEDYKKVLDLAFELFPDSEIFCEPGRWLSQGAVYARTNTIQFNEIENLTNIKISLSSELHCKWSDDLEIKCTNSDNNKKSLVQISGPTCFEKDNFGVFNIPLNSNIVDSEFIVNGLTGYCIAFNTSFNGIAPAEVIIK